MWGMLEDPGMKEEDMMSRVYFCFMVSSTVGPGRLEPLSAAGKVFWLAYFAASVHHWKVLSRFATRTMLSAVGISIDATLELEKIERTASKDTLKMV